MAVASAARSSTLQLPPIALRGNCSRHLGGCQRPLHRVGKAYPHRQRRASAYEEYSVMIKTSHICARASRPTIAALASLALSLHLSIGDLAAAALGEIVESTALAMPGKGSLGGAYAPGDRIKIGVFEILGGKSNPKEALLNGLVE